MTKPLIIDITTANFDTEVIKSDVPVLMQFNADWCIPCQKLAPKLLELAIEKGESLKIVQINVDSSPELAKIFKIRLLPALFVMNRGEKYAEAVGNVSKDALEKLLAQALQKHAKTNIQAKNRHSKLGDKPPRR